MQCRLHPKTFKRFFHPVYLLRREPALSVDEFFRAHYRNALIHTSMDHRFDKLLPTTSAEVKLIHYLAGALFTAVPENNLLRTLWANKDIRPN